MMARRPFRKTTRALGDAVTLKARPELGPGRIVSIGEHKGRPLYTVEWPAEASGIRSCREVLGAELERSKP